MPLIREGQRGLNVKDLLRRVTIVRQLVWLSNRLRKNLSHDAETPRIFVIHTVFQRCDGGEFRTPKINVLTGAWKTCSPSLFFPSDRLDFSVFCALAREDEQIGP